MMLVAAVSGWLITNVVLKRPCRVVAVLACKSINETKSINKWAGEGPFFVSVGAGVVGGQQGERLAGAWGFGGSV
jgi:hypothetical protein